MYTAMSPVAKPMPSLLYRAVHQMILVRHLPLVGKKFVADQEKKVKATIARMQ